MVAGPDAHRPTSLCRTGHASGRILPYARATRSRLHTVRVHGTNTIGHNKTFNYILTIV
jgi:hypothetical protein